MCPHTGADVAQHTTSETRLAVYFGAIPHTEPLEWLSGNQELVSRSRQEMAERYLVPKEPRKYSEVSFGHFRGALADPRTNLR